MYGELGRDGRLTNTLEAGEHDRDDPRALLERRVHRPHQVAEFFFADLDEMLARRDSDLAAGSILDACRDLLAETALFDLREERPRDVEVDVGLQQRHADVAQGIVDALFGEFAHASQTFGRVLESLGDSFEHEVAQRLARLPYQLRDLLTTVAVARIGCTAELLAYVNELSRLQVATLCDELVERRLLVEDGGKYRTAHPLVADVIRRDLSESRLAELHRALALGLDETAPKDRDTLVGRIARHAEGGGLSQLAYRNALLAAQAALQRLAFDEALTWLDLAASQADAEEAGEVDRLTGEILRVAGWTEAPVVRPHRDSMIQRLEVGDLDLRGANGVQESGSPKAPPTQPGKV